MASPASASPAACTSPQPQSLSACVESTCTSLRVLYACIGLTEGQQADLLSDLDSKLRDHCASTIADAQKHVRQIEEEIQVAIRAAERVAKQMHQQIPAQLTQGQIDPSLNLQALRTLHEDAFASLQTQKDLHLSVLKGDLKSVQALYTLLELSGADIDGEMMEQVHADSTDLSAARIARVQAEQLRLQAQQTARNDSITSLLCEMSGMWSRLGFGAADIAHAEIDPLLMASAQRKAPVLPPTQTTLKALALRKDELAATVLTRERDIESKTIQIAALHKRLGTSVEDIASLHAQIAALASGPSPLSNDVIAFFESCISTLEIQKAARMQQLVCDLRVQLTAVQDDLQLSSLERGAFKPFQSTVFNDSVLEMHEAELARLQARKAQLAPVFSSVAKWRAMVTEVAQFEESSKDPDRLKKRGAHIVLAYEEKMRKKRDMLLPALERKLLEQVLSYEGAHEGDEVTLHGMSLRQELEQCIAVREEGKSARRQKDEESRVQRKTAALGAIEEKIGNKVAAAAAAAAAAGTTPLKRSSVNTMTTPRAAAAATPRAAPIATPRSTRPSEAAATPAAAAPTPSMKLAPVQAIPTIADSTPLKASTRIGQGAPATPAPAAASTFITPAATQRTTSRIPMVTPKAVPSFRPVSENDENAAEESLAAPVQAPTTQQQRSALGESTGVRANARVAPILEDDDVVSKPVVAASPIAASPTPILGLNVEDHVLGLDQAATLMEDVEARLGCCQTDEDREAVYTQSIESKPTPKLTQLSELYYERSKVREKMGRSEEAQADVEASKEYLKQHQIAPPSDAAHAAAIPV